MERDSEVSLEQGMESSGKIRHFSEKIKDGVLTVLDKLAENKEFLYTLTVGLALSLLVVNTSLKPTKELIVPMAAALGVVSTLALIATGKYAFTLD